MGAAVAPPTRIPPLTGRDAERSRVQAFVTGLPEGPRALLIRGEAGIGKTTLWRHGVEACRRSGARVLLSRPAEEEMPLALVGLVDLFEHADPELAFRSEDDPTDRGRAVLEALRRLAEAGPVVVAIDDTQWLDSVSARALRYAALRLGSEPVGALLTARIGSESSDPLETVEWGDRVETLELGPLTLGALRGVVGGTVAKISRTALRRVHEASGGNPLYAIELARAFAREEQAHRSAAALQLPDSLQAAIAQRVDRAPAELAPLLEVVSALGHTPVVDLRYGVPDVDVGRLLALAEQHELLTVDDDRQVRFSHPLLAAAVYGRMSLLARRSLHARLAERAVDPDVLARHLALSTDEADAAVATLLEEAAGRASGRGAYGLAAEFAGHSLRLTPHDAADAGRRRALAEVECLAKAGEVGRALELADALVAALPPGPGRAEALVLRSDIESDDPAVSVAFLERAVEDAGGDDALRATVLQELAFTLFLYFGDVAEAVARAREAVAIAQRSGDVAVEATAGATLAHLEAISGSPKPAVMARAIELEDEIGRARLSRSSRILLVKQHRWAGQLEPARAVLEAEGSGHDFQRPYRMYDLALIEIAAGNLATADELVSTGMEAMRDAGDTFGETAFFYALALVEAWLGRAAEARATAGRLVERAVTRKERPDIVAGRRVLGLLALSEGDFAAAASELEEGARLLEEMGIGHPGLFPVLPDAVEALAGAGELASARALLTRLEHQAAAVDSAWAETAAERCRGVLLLTEGQAARAAATLERSAAEFDRLGHRPDAARSVLAHGSALLRAGRRTQAAAAFADARRRFGEMGAELWEARAVEELERAAPARASGELTRAERRVAALVAEGRRNREIAQALFMSVATVEAHLTRIYRKLQIGSRSELARLVAEGTIQISDDEGDV